MHEDVGYDAQFWSEELYGKFGDAGRAGDSCKMERSFLIVSRCPLSISLSLKVSRLQILQRHAAARCCVL